MPLPALNTEGINIGNALLRAAQIKNLNYENALLKSQMDPNSFGNQAAAQKLRTDQRKAQLEDVARAMGYIDAHPTSEAKLNAYRKVKAVMLKENPEFENYIPGEEVFYKDDASGTAKVLDVDKLGNYTTNIKLAVEMQLHPKEGVPFETSRKNPQTGEFEDVQSMYKNGVLTEIGVIPTKKFGTPTETAEGTVQTNLRTGEIKKIFGRKEVRAPQNRTIQRGNKKVTQEYNPTTGTWEDISEGPAWAPKKDKTLVPVQQPDGSIIYTKRSEAVGKQVPSKAGPTPTETRVTQKMIADAATKIGLNKSNKALEGQKDLFNQYADKPYAYQWDESGWGGKWTKVNLPIVNGKQVTAKDVQSTAVSRSMSYEAALAEILELAKGEKK